MKIFLDRRSVFLLVLFACCLVLCFCFKFFLFSRYSKDQDNCVLHHHSVIYTEVVIKQIFFF